MKPALLLLLSYGAGLATGLLRFGDPLTVLVVLGSIGLWSRRRPASIWPLVLLLGRLTALAVLARESHRCGAKLPAGVIALKARVQDPVFVDAPVARVAPLGAGCDGAIDARWPGGTEVQAGSVVRLEGRWIRRPDRSGRADGILIVSQSQVTRLVPGPADRVRNWIGHSVRELYGRRSGTVEALLVNRRGAMSAELRDRYARAGLVHILSISGFHVGVIAGWVALIGVLAGVPRARAAVGAAAVAFGYVMFLGWPAPAARAALLAGLVAQFHLRQRNPQAVSLLAVAALLVVLLDPWAVLDPGAWLSVAALAGALQATRWSDRAVGTRWWHRTAAASVGATVATAPITATLFGLVSLAGVLLNFIAVPLAAVAVPGLLLSLLLSAVAPSLAHPVAAGAGAVLGLLDQVAWWGGSWDASAVVQPAGPAAALPWLGILGLAGWSISGGTTRAEAVRRTALGLAAGTWLLLGVENYQAVRDATSGLTLHFLDVGQGDAALVRTPAGRWVLIDAGPRDERTDAGRRVVAPFLARHRVGGLAVAVLSHAHADHLGGFGSVLERYPASRMLEPAELVADSLYLGFLDELEVLGIPWQAARDGLRFELDSVRFTVLHPDTGWSGWRLDLNEDSVMLLVEYGAFRALFSGDAGVAAEARLAGRVGPVDLLKVGHHGSRSASGEAWLAELRPQAAIISSGNGNRYGHPHREVLERLVRRGIGVWRTDLQGTLTVTTDGRSFSLSGRGRHETIHTRGLSGAPE